MHIFCSLQISHGGLQAHSSMTSRASVGGSSVYSGSMNGAISSVSGTSPGSGAVNTRGTVPGLGVSPSMLSGASPRITNSVSSMNNGAVGGSLGRTINSGTGLNLPSFSGSRVNLGTSNVSGGLGMQGPGRPLTNVLPQGKNLSSQRPFCSFRDVLSF